MEKGESSKAGAKRGGAGVTAAATPGYELPWYSSPCRSLIMRSKANATFYRVEKYRPVYLDQIVGNTETVERLKIIAKDGNMPHVIISGMPGIG